jgi:pimeloyl-ACP methyl ester carboxylesterase
VAATKRALDASTGPVILVGHSWAGTVITEAGAHDKVAALVYVAAFAPDAGQSSSDLGKDGPLLRGRPAFAPTAQGFSPSRPRASPGISRRTCPRRRPLSWPSPRVRSSARLSTRR